MNLNVSVREEQISLVTGIPKDNNGVQQFANPNEKIMDIDSSLQLEHGEVELNNNDGRENELSKQMLNNKEWTGLSPEGTKDKSVMNHGENKMNVNTNIKRNEGQMNVDEPFVKKANEESTSIKEAVMETDEENTIEEDETNAIETESEESFGEYQKNTLEEKLDNDLNVMNTDRKDIRLQQNRDVKVSNLHIGNLKKEISGFVDNTKNITYVDNKMLIGLRPANLGSVEIMFVKSEDVINIHIEVESKDAMEKVSEILDEIKNSLDNKEVKTELFLKEKSETSDKGENRQDDKNQRDGRKDGEKDSSKQDDNTSNRFDELIFGMLGEIKND